VIVAGLAVTSTGVLVQAARRVARPAAIQGQRIEAREGDLIVIRDAARVRIVHCREATVRSIFNPAQRWLVLLVDYATPDGPDGRVDMTYTHHDIDGEWPLENRWEGPAVVEDYSLAGEGASAAAGLGLVGPRGLVQLLTPPAERLFRDASAIAVLHFRGAGRAGGGRRSFDETEQQQVATAMRNAETRSRLPSGASVSARLDAFDMTAGIGSVTGGGMAPVRVGGNVRAPAKIVDVAPVLPESARKAGIHGVVILELTIGTDGAVTNARVLRSIPLLDAAALEAVRQWRFEPTSLNGQPVPVILTATVPFQ
jgi:TonB family protein